MPAADQSALLIEYGNIEVGDDAGSLIDLGAVRNVKFTGRQERIKVDSDNKGTIINKVRITGVVDFDWLEPGHMPNLEQLFKGLVTRTTQAGSLVTGASQVVASGKWLYDKFIELQNQNNDLSKPTITSVTLGTNGVIVVNTDYFIVKDAGTGRWGIVIRDSATVTTEAQSATIVYNYTPATAQVLSGGSSKTATPRFVKITGPSENDSNIERIITLDSAIAASDMLIPFVDVENAGDVGVMPVSLEGDKGSTWTITDEINAT